MNLNKLRGKIIAIDFDGVLHGGGFRGIDPHAPPRQGARDFVRALHCIGARVIIFTCRAKSAEGLQGVAEWLFYYGFPDVPVSAEKPHAHIYIDDRAVRFDGDFPMLLRILPDLCAEWTEEERKIE